MKKLLGCIKYDLVLQWKGGFHLAYFVIVVIFVIILKKIPSMAVDVVTLLMIFQDPSIFGFLFIGAILLLEKDQHTLESVFVSPLSIEEYIISKVISIEILALASSFAIVLPVMYLDFNPIYLALGVFLTSTLFTLIGLAVSSYTKNLNSFLTLCVPIITFIQLPILDYFNVIKSPLFYIFPTQATLLLLNGAFADISMLELVYSIIYLVSCIIAAFFITRNIFYKNIILKIGSEN